MQEIHAEVEKHLDTFFTHSVVSRAKSGHDASIASGEFNRLKAMIRRVFFGEPDTQTANLFSPEQPEGSEGRVITIKGESAAEIEAKREAAEKREQAVLYVVTRGYSREAAEIIVEKNGADVILASKGESVEEPEAEAPPQTVEVAPPPVPTVAPASTDAPAEPQAAAVKDEPKADANNQAGTENQ